MGPLWAPQCIKLAFHHIAHPCAFSAVMVIHHVLLSAIGPPLVPTHPRAHLFGTHTVGVLPLGLVLRRIQILDQSLHSQTHTVFPRAGLSGAHQSCGHMHNACTGLNFVSVLPTRSSSREKRNGKIVRLALQILRIIERFPQYGNRHR